ncbi:MAG: tRNA (adenosine(37)-N6)-threonylcarbamoyltransferase complex ATPase subunit type 1 TsaE [Actinomycetota bacterium]
MQPSWPPLESEPFTIEARSADETRRLAVALSPVLVPGDLIVLAGDLGSGKTTFVQGIAAGLGITEQVTSPTFILMKEYSGGRYPFMHLDIYRLGRYQELIDLGYDEFLDPSYVLAVEWGDMIEPMLPQEHLRVSFAYSDNDDDSTRRISLSSKGSRWVERIAQVKDLAMELFPLSEGSD